MDTEDDVVLRARGVGRVFGEGELAVRALHPTDLDVRRGEALVILGPSGSGKTTLLSLLGLVLSPTEGELWLEGRPLRGADAAALAALRRDRIGFVFQQFNLIQGLSAEENAALPLLLRGEPAPARRRAAQAALAEVGMADRASFRPRQLSGGQQQRVAIARALAGGAPILLADEPTASLDGVTGRGVLATLRRLADAGRAVVIVTHDERVLSVADRIVEVIDGHASVRAPGREAARLAGHSRKEPP